MQPAFKTSPRPLAKKVKIKHPIFWAFVRILTKQIKTSKINHERTLKNVPTKRQQSESKILKVIQTVTAEYEASHIDALQLLSKIVAAKMGDEFRA